MTGTTYVRPSEVLARDVMFALSVFLIPVKYRLHVTSFLWVTDPVSELPHAVTGDITKSFFAIGGLVIGSDLQNNLTDEKLNTNFSLAYRDYPPDFIV
jgi:hypothetical protein